MRTNIDIDEKLLKEAFQVSKSRTKKDLVHEALSELIRLRKKKNLLDLSGQLEFADNYDYKQARESKHVPD